MNRLLGFCAVCVIASPAGALKVERLQSIRGQTLAGQGIEVVSGEALVRFSTSSLRNERAAVLAGIGASVASELPTVGWTRVSLATGISVAQGLSNLERLPGVLEAAPNHVYHARKVPNDPYFWTQYHLDRINAPQGWDDEDGTRNRVTIAVADAGVSGSHPDLAPKLIGTSQFCDPGPSKSAGGDDVACANEPSGSPVPACNHATRVAGVAAAATDDNANVAGVSWAARLFSIRLFRIQDCDSSCGDASGQSCSTDDTAIVNGIDYARTVLAAAPATYGKIVLNLSIGEALACPAAIQTAVTNAVAAGVTIVASAGNGGGAVEAPANCTSVIPVGATNSSDGLASFSSRGAELAANGVVAPGVSLVTTDVNGGITPPSDAASGTSFSAPIVSGLAALLLSRNTALTPALVGSHIRNGADNIGLAATSQGAGRVNVCKSLKLAQGLPTSSCASGSSGLAGFAKVDPLVVFPNPFREADQGFVTIRLPVSFQGKNPTVRIYTMDGQIVRTIQSQATAAVWDGRNDKGNQVASGVYIVIAKAEGAVKTFKLAVLR